MATPNAELTSLVTWSVVFLPLSHANQSSSNSVPLRETSMASALFDTNNTIRVRFGTNQHATKRGEAADAHAPGECDLVPFASVPYPPPSAADNQAEPGAGAASHNDSADDPTGAVIAETILATGGAVVDAAFAPMDRSAAATALEASTTTMHSLALAVHPKEHAKTAWRSIYQGRGALQLWAIHVTKAKTGSLDFANGDQKAAPSVRATCTCLLEHAGRICFSLAFRPRPPRATSELAGVLACCLGNGALAIYRLPKSCFVEPPSSEGEKESVTAPPLMPLEHAAIAWAPGTQPSNAGPSQASLAGAPTAAIANVAFVPPSHFTCVAWLPDPPSAPAKRLRHMLATGNQDGTCSIYALKAVDDSADPDDVASKLAIDAVMTITVDTRGTIVQSLVFKPPCVPSGGVTTGMGVCDALLLVGTSRGQLRLYEIDAHALLGVHRDSNSTAGTPPRIAPLETVRCLHECHSMRARVTGLAWPASRGLGEAFCTFDDGALLAHYFHDIPPSMRRGSSSTMRLQERIFRPGGCGMGPNLAVQDDGTVIETSHLTVGSLKFIVSPQLPLVAERLDTDTGADERVAKKQKVAASNSNEAMEDEDLDDIRRLGATRRWLCYGSSVGEVGLTSAYSGVPMRKTPNGIIFPMHLCVASQRLDKESNVVELLHNPRADVVDSFSVQDTKNGPFGSSFARIHGSFYDGRYKQKTKIAKLPKSEGGKARDRMTNVDDVDPTPHPYRRLFVPPAEEMVNCASWASAGTDDVPTLVVGCQGFARILLLDLFVASGLAYTENDRYTIPVD